MRRTLPLVLALALAGPAFAAGPPGSPPWRCSVDSACEGDTCIRSTNFAGQFQMHAPWFEPDVFTILTNATSPQTKARLFETLDAATAELEKVNISFSAVLLRSNHMADAHGFRIWGVSTFGDGRKEVSENSMLFSCNSLLRP